MPHIIGIMGNLGAGKTTVGSMMAWKIKNAVESRGGSIQLFANCELTGSQRMKVAEDWFKVADAHGSVILWDEAHRSFDSRKSQSYQNILATDILTFARKMASIQIFITPSVGRLDNRIRETLEVLLHVRQIGNKGIKIDYYDFQADGRGPLGQLIHTRFLPSFKVKQIHKLNLFDTHSFVSGFPLPKTERQAIKFMEELERHHNEARRAINDKHRTRDEDQDRPASATLSIPVDPSGEVSADEPRLSLLEGGQRRRGRRKDLRPAAGAGEVSALGTESETSDAIAADLEIDILRLGAIGDDPDRTDEV